MTKGLMSEGQRIAMDGEDFLMHGKYIHIYMTQGHVFCNGVVMRYVRMAVGCRKMFEPFGGLQAAVAAARASKGAEEIVAMDGRDGLFTANPDYTAPCLEELLIVYVAFDVLAINGEVWGFRS
jgi:hypothetical protein